jgi:hypothetical protein
MWEREAALGFWISPSKALGLWLCVLGALLPLTASRLRTLVWRALRVSHCWSRFKRRCFSARRHAQPHLPRGDGAPMIAWVKLGLSATLSAYQDAHPRPQYDDRMRLWEPPPRVSDPELAFLDVLLRRDDASRGDAGNGRIYRLLSDLSDTRAAATWAARGGGTPTLGVPASAAQRARRRDATSSVAGQQKNERRDRSRYRERSVWAMRWRWRSAPSANSLRSSSVSSSNSGTGVERPSSPRATYTT